jgi:predicted nucleic acid-binding protein
LVEVVNNGDIDFGSGIEFILKTNVLNEITILIEQKQIFSKKDVIELFFQYQHDLSQWVLNMENDIFEKPMPIDWIKRKLN